MYVSQAAVAEAREFGGAREDSSDVGGYPALVEQDEPGQPLPVDGTDREGRFAVGIKALLEHGSHFGDQVESCGGLGAARLEFTSAPQRICHQRRALPCRGSR